MAQYSMQMISFLSSADEGPFTSQSQDKAKPEHLSDGGNFKHYRRKKTNKAPRKRTFIANMTKQPTILTDSLASSAQGIGKGLGGSLSSATSTNDSSGSATTPTGGSLQALQQQRHSAEAGLHGLPVLYPPVVYGTKHAPARSPQSQPNQNQPYYYDAELAAALAEYQPMGAAPQTFGNAAFRAVTTSQNELPPSSMARAICTGLVQHAAPAAETKPPAPAAAPQKPAAAAAPAAGMQAQAGASPAPGAAAFLPMLALMGYDAMSAAAAAAACTKPAQRASMSPFSRITPSSSPQQQQQLHSQASSMSSMQTSVTRMSSDNSVRSSSGSVDPARLGYASPYLPGVPSLQPAPTAVYPAAPLPQQPNRLAAPSLAFGKAEAGSGSRVPPSARSAAPSQHLVVPLDPSGWSQLPPRASPQAEPAWGAGHHDDEQLWSPSRVICHTLINTGAYGCVYKGSLRTDEDVSASRPSPFVEVAVKCLRTGLSPAKLLRSFQVEAELLPSLSHPHVVPVWYVNADPAAGAVCLVQELAPLGTLADYIHGRPHSLPQQQVERAVLTRLAAQLGVSAPQLMQRLGCGGADADAPALSQLRRQLVLLSLLRDVGCALSYLASLPQPVVHRDVKPANVLISERGVAMLADFGVAKLVPSAGRAEQLTQSWGSAGGSDGEGAVKRRRVSDGTSQLSDQAQAQRYGYGNGTSYPPYSPASSAPSSPDASEETSWLDALFSDDLPVDAAQSACADEDSLGWLNQLLDQDEVLGPAALGPAANANANGKRPLLQSWGSNAWAAEEEQGSQAAGAVSWLLDHDLQGTVHYAAPEDIRPSGAAAPAFPLGPAADVFSLGYCIWEALGAQRPWAGMKAAALASSVGVKGARLPINRGWSLKLQGLMRRVWQADPAARPPAHEVAGVLEAEICALMGAV